MVRRIQPKVEPLFFDEYARDCFVAIAKAVGSGENVWHGAVTVQGDELYATDGAGKVWIAVRLPGVRPLHGLRIPADVARDLGSRRYSGTQVSLDEPGLQQWVTWHADRTYRFRDVRETVDHAPPAPERTIDVADVSEFVLGLGKGKVVRVDGAKAPGPILRRICGALSGPVTLGVVGDQVVSVHRDGARAAGWTGVVGDVRADKTALTLDAETLIAAIEPLKWIAGNTLPILTCVGLDVYAEGLRVFATDLEASGSIRVGNVGTKPLHSWAVPYKELRAAAGRYSGTVFLRAVYDGTSLTATEEHPKPNRIEISGGRRVELLPLHSIEDFPVLTYPTEAFSFDVAGWDFDEAVGALTPFASTDEARPILTGMLLTAENDRIVAVATDSYRLGVATVGTMNAPPGPLDLGKRRVVPARVLRQIAHACREAGTVRLVLGDTNIWAYTDSAWWASRLIEGEFPNWGQLFPTDSTSTLTVDAAQFASAVRACDYGNAPGSFSAYPVIIDGLAVSAKKEEQKATETFDGSWEGEPVNAGFNPGYLIECLEFAGTAHVSLAFNGPLNPVIITGSDSARTGLLMPVRIS